MKMRSLGLLVLVALVWSFWPPLRADTAPVRDGVFIHLSHGPEGAHRVLMALRMAEIMSADKDVLVYCDIKAIAVVFKDAADLTYKQFPSSRAQLAKLLQAGVTLRACPGRLQAAGKTAADLPPEIQVAQKDAFFNFTRGRILSLDY